MILKKIYCFRRDRKYENEIRRCRKIIIPSSMHPSLYTMLFNYSSLGMSFPVIHKVGNVDNFVLPKYANK